MPCFLRENTGIQTLRQKIRSKTPLLTKYYSAAVHLLQDAWRRRRGSQPQQPRRRHEPGQPARGAAPEHPQAARDSISATVAQTC